MNLRLLLVANLRVERNPFTAMGVDNDSSKTAATDTKRKCFILGTIVMFENLFIGIGMMVDGDCEGRISIGLSPLWLFSFGCAGVMRLFATLDGKEFKPRVSRFTVSHQIGLSWFLILHGKEVKSCRHSEYTAWPLGAVSMSPPRRAESAVSR